MKNAFRRIFSRLGWFLYGLIAVILFFLIVLYFQDAFKGYFIGSYLPTRGELEDLSIKRGDEEFVFDRIEFQEYDVTSARERSYTLTPEQYSEVINLLNISTAADFHPGLLSRFETENIARLVIFVKPVNQEEPAVSYPYQELQFVKNGDFFRLERLNEQGPYIWDYYKSPSIYLKVKKLLGIRN